MKPRDSKGRFISTKKEVEQLTTIKMNWKKLLLDIAKLVIGALAGVWGTGGL